MNTSLNGLKIVARSFSGATDNYGNVAILPIGYGIPLALVPNDLTLYASYTMCAYNNYWFIKCIKNASAYTCLANTSITGTVYYVKYPS